MNRHVIVDFIEETRLLPTIFNLCHIRVAVLNSVFILLHLFNGINWVFIVLYNRLCVDNSKNVLIFCVALCIDRGIVRSSVWRFCVYLLFANVWQRNRFCCCKDCSVARFACRFVCRIDSIKDAYVCPLSACWLVFSDIKVWQYSVCSVFLTNLLHFYEFLTECSLMNYFTLVVSRIFFTVCNIYTQWVKKTVPL